MAQAASKVDDMPQYLNVGVGQDHSVTEFYETAMRVIGVDAELIYDVSKPDGMKQKLLDSSLARKSAGWNPETTLESGIEETYRWYVEHI